MKDRLIFDPNKQPPDQYNYYLHNYTIQIFFGLILVQVDQKLDQVMPLFFLDPRV